MADLASAIEKRIFAEFYTRWRQENFWSGILRNLTGEVGSGDKVTYFYDTTDYKSAITDRATDFAPGQTTVSDLEWGEPTLQTVGSVELLIDQHVTIDQLLNYTLPQVTNQNWLDSMARGQSRVLTERINNFMRDKLLGYDHKTVSGADDLGDHADFDIEIGNTTAANLTSTAHRTAVLAAMKKARTLANKYFFPKDGRYMVMPIDYHDMISDYIVEELKLPSSGDAVNREALVEGSTARLYGWDLIPDNSRKQVIADGDERELAVICGVRGYGAGYAIRFQNFQSFESEKYYGTRMRGRAYYGAAVVEPSKFLTMKTNLTA